MTDIKAAKMLPPESQAREHAAWLDFMQELLDRGIEPNDTEKHAALVCAVRKWGEELHQLRVDKPQYVRVARDEARAMYQGQYERGTYPEDLRRG